ncbi:MAG: hypothetical protein JNL10_10445 [Verrucomicrobiales bacterium]|nr:hypothetical protein [Verrucomicrobiales bacterium]
MPQPRSEFRAPASRMLVIVTALASAILIGIPILGWASLPASVPGFSRLLLTAVPLLILLGALPFAVRGYRVQKGTLRVLRPGWVTHLGLDRLLSAEADPAAMSGSLRIAGNGGLFSFTGWFWSRRLGRYRAFVTDPARSVVLKFSDRTVVVSPDVPEEFVAALRAGTPRTGRE